MNKYFNNEDLNNKAVVLVEQFGHKVTSRMTENEINSLYEQSINEYLGGLGMGFDIVFMECGDILLYDSDNEYTFTIEDIMANGIDTIENEVC